MPLSEMASSITGGKRTRESEHFDAPLVSIITVVFNARNALSDILTNLAGYDSHDFELIIIDGGSSDGTADLLREWDNRIDYWLSEPDKGLYDAMNKAQEHARGEFLFHLNAGDSLLHLPVRELQEALRDNIDIVSFRVSEDGVREFVPSYGWMLRLRNTLHHQGTFYRRKTFLPYRLEYRKIADFDVNQRLALGGATARCHDVVVARHDSGGVADTINGYEESKRMMRKNHGAFWMWLSVFRGELKGIRIRRTAALKRWLQKTRLANGN